MTAAALDLSLDAGSTFSQRLTWRAGPGRQLVDLTGCTGTISLFFISRPPLVMPVVLGGPSGTIDILIDAATSASFGSSVGRYQIDLVLSNGDKRRLIAGHLNVIAAGRAVPSVSKPASDPVLITISEAEIIIADTAAQGPPGPPGDGSVDVDLLLLFKIALL